MPRSRKRLRNHAASGDDVDGVQAKPSDPDYARLWKIVDEKNGDRYTAYQKETARPIPVVVITPI